MVKALEAARRVNDYATASRVFEGLRFKVESKEQYQQYLDELKDIREELGKSNSSAHFTPAINSCRRHPQGGSLQRADVKPFHSNHSLQLQLLRHTSSSDQSDFTKLGHHPKSHRTHHPF
ncbi:hypothetical protein TRICI_000555 [Trichomonascus ciferrii]|uniref:Cytochrome c oxidase subunit 6, mitochondrial n=1 Tax=Trichomonascus ciferrii TaxID=44093 RepID=A0A642VD11_9ASCO|nr:hypothetical protein TRICI_000555 [Trichomonascus ciferrii]